jgi:DNA-binding transcriptional ArsR family regulator
MVRKGGPLPLSDPMLEAVAARFRILGEPQRLKILQLLEQGERTVGEIAEALGALQPNISRHLQTLYDAGILGRRRSGASVIYSIADPTIFRLCEIVCRSAQREATRQVRALAKMRWSS